MFPIFLWVKKYKSLENFQLFLDDNYQVSLKQEKDFITGLEITKQEKLDKKGFYGKNIDDIKVLVGKNGSGKTTVLEALGKFSRANTILNRNENIGEYFILYKQEEKENEYLMEGYYLKEEGVLHQFLPNDLGQEYSVLIDEKGKNIEKFEGSTPAGSILLQVHGTTKVGWNKRKELYVQNHYRGSYVYKATTGLKETSKVEMYNYILSSQKKLKQNYQNAYFSLEVLKKKTYQYRLEERVRDLEKLNSNEFLNKISVFSEKNTQKKIEDVILDAVCAYLYTYKLYEEINTLDNVDEIKKKIEYEYSLYETYKKKKSKKERLTFALRYIERLDSTKEVQESIEALYKAAQKLEDNKILLKENDEGIYRIEIKEDLKLRNFLKKYDDILTYNWRIGSEASEICEILEIEEKGMSAGEQVRLQQFASIFRFINGELQEKKYITLFLDEVETSLHPEWCRRLINDYLKELETNYPTKKFKLIFATHSPFILSDILADNITALVNENGKTSVNLSPLKKSFGGNIHNLLKQNMFMDSTFGEFARIKIKKFVKEIKEAKSYEELKKLSDSLLLREVGEPLVKRRLEIMIKEKMKNVGNSKEYYEMKIQEYKKKIERLEEVENK